MPIPLFIVLSPIPVIKRCKTQDKCIKNVHINRLKIICGTFSQLFIEHFLFNNLFLIIIQRRANTYTRETIEHIVSSHHTVVNFIKYFPGNN